MIKKLICVSFAAIIAVSAVGCSDSSADNKASKTNQQDVADILSGAAETQAATFEASAPIIDNSAADIEYPELDYTAEVDLTTLNSNMVYSEVSGMMNAPDNYIGKTVKMNGTFDVYTDINTGKYYYACIIQDATACCQNGIEFLWKGEHSFPEDYPSVGTALTVGGVFETYDEDGKTYCRLKDADVVFGA